MKIGNYNLKPWQLLIVILLAGPPVVSVIAEVGPGRWVNELQDELLGFHSGKLSVLAVLGMEFACLYIVSVVVRWVTGRTIVQLLTKKKKDDSEEQSNSGNQP